MFDTGEGGAIKYLVLLDRAVPYLLARVRWPDVAQAISAASPDWIEDPGLFDLPYDPSAVAVSFPQAASVAAGWGAQLHAEIATDVASYMRRMPANWSDLSPSERRMWGIDFVGRRPARAGPAQLLRSLRARISGVSAPTDAGRPVVAVATTNATSGATVGAHAGNGRGRLTRGANRPAHTEPERRSKARVRLVGRAHIRTEHTTYTAGLVDLSERGLQCVLPEPAPLVALGTTFAGPFLLESEVEASRVCLDVAGRISWQRNGGAGTHFGVAFDDLAGEDTEGVRHLLVAAGGRR